MKRLLLWHSLVWLSGPGSQLPALPAANGATLRPCRRRVEEVKDALNSAAAGGSAARRIAGEAGREYILHKDPQPPGPGDQQPQGQQQQQQQQQQEGQEAEQQGQQEGERALRADAAAAPPGRGRAPGAQPATQHASAGAEAAEAAAEAAGGGGVLDICFEVDLREDGAGGWVGGWVGECVGSQPQQLDWHHVAAPVPTSGSLFYLVPRVACLLTSLDVPAAADGEDGLEWEDVDAPGSGGSGGDKDAQHWRERAAARQRYWSLSHGFQMGRKLATWGEQEAQGAGGGAGAAQQAQEQQEEAGDGGGSARKALIGEACRLPRTCRVPNRHPTHSP